jgi:hypothetical protein
MPGEGAKPSLAASYSHLGYDGGAPELDFGSPRKLLGVLRPGKGGKGGRVTSRKQAIAIGLSEARKKGAKVLRKKW